MVFEHHDDSRMALLYLVARELNESLDLDQILRRVLIATVRIAGGANGSFFVFDEYENLSKSLFVSGVTVVDVEKEVVNLLLEQGMAGWVKKHKQAVLVNDVTKDKRWYTDKNNPDLLSPLSAVAVPLLAGQRTLGVLTITHEKPAYFDAADLTMLTAVAEQAASAILNARLYQSEQHRRKLANTLAELSRRMNVIQNLDDLLELVLDNVALLVESDRSAIFLLAKGQLTITTARGIKNLAELRNLPVKLYKHDFALPIKDAHAPVLSADLQTTDTWFKDVIDADSRGWMGVPLLAGNALLGILTVSSLSRAAYTPQDVEIICALAGQAAIAIKNTSLLNQLQDTRRRYTRLFEGSSDMLLIMDPDGVILDANRKACQIFRRPKDVLVGSHLGLLDSSLKDIFNQQCYELTVGREVTSELSIKDAYGQPITLEVNAKQTKVDGQTAIQWSGRDVTARHELARLRQDLTNMIVHDLRGPMGTLLGTLQMLALLLEEKSDDPLYHEAGDLIEIANRSGQYLKDLIDSVLDLSRLEQGDSPLSVAPYPLARLFADVQDQTSPQAAMKRIDISFPTFEEGVIVELDHGIVRRVLVNLVDNGIKYTPSQGRVEVSAELDAQTLTVRVADNGPGIPPQSQERIFGKFARATADATIHGVGLGLAFCKMAVEAHGGQIWLESEIDAGSSFIFSIPRRRPAL
ncbi:MAG: GAF domain-containing protein [Anaerolineae bacterium]